MKKSEKFIQKLKRVAMDFPEVEDEVYLLMEHISSLLEEKRLDTVDPGTLFSCVDGVRKELAKSEYDPDRKIMGSMIYIPYIIERIADSAFSERFQELWDATYGPYRVSLEEGYADHVQAAVDWWTEKLQSRSSRDVTDREEEMFQYFLAKGIMKKMFISSQLPEDKSCDLFVEDEPCHTLYSAGTVFGLRRGRDYPYHTSMHITSSFVTVRDLHGEEIIWQRPVLCKEKQK